MQSIPATAPWHKIACDIIGPLPLTRDGNKWIVVFMDYFTKWPECVPVPDTKTTRLARIFVEQIICRFGVPAELLTDQGRNLTSTLMQEVCRLLNVKKLQTTAYHPQCDGMVERFNRTLENMLSAYVANGQDDWDQLLPYVLFAYRSSIHESTQETPFFLNMGRDPVLPVDLPMGLPNPAYTDVEDYRCELAEKLQKAWDLAEASIHTAQVKQKKYYDRKAVNHSFLPGDRVYLNSPLSVKGKTPKLHRPWKGPYRVINVTDDGTGASIIPCGRGQRKASMRVNVQRLKFAPSTRGMLQPLAHTSHLEDDEVQEDDQPSSNREGNVEDHQPTDMLTLPLRIPEQRRIAPDAVPRPAASRYQLRSRSTTNTAQQHELDTENQMDQQQNRQTPVDDTTNEDFQVPVLAHQEATLAAQGLQSHQPTHVHSLIQRSTRPIPAPTASRNSKDIQDIPFVGVITVDGQKLDTTWRRRVDHKWNGREATASCSLENVLTGTQAEMDLSEGEIDEELALINAERDLALREEGTNNRSSPRLEVSTSPISQRGSAPPTPDMRSSPEMHDPDWEGAFEPFKYLGQPWIGAGSSDCTDWAKEGIDNWKRDPISQTKERTSSITVTPSSFVEQKCQTTIARSTIIEQLNPEIYSGVQGCSSPSQTGYNATLYGEKKTTQLEWGKPTSDRSFTVTKYDCNEETPRTSSLVTANITPRKREKRAGRQRQRRRFAASRRHQ